MRQKGSFMPKGIDSDPRLDFLFVSSLGLSLSVFSIYFVGLGDKKRRKAFGCFLSLRNFYSWS